MRGGVSGLLMGVWERKAGRQLGDVRVGSSEGLWRPHRRPQSELSCVGPGTSR